MEKGAIEDGVPDEYDASSGSSGEHEKDTDNSADEEMDSDPETCGNSGWANAMSRVLNTATKTGNFILSKAKKDADVKAKKDKDIEVVDEKGNLIQNVPENTEVKSKSYKEIRRERFERQKKKVLWEAMCRTKPNVTQKDRERELVKIATRGIVHLFNAVEKHQKGNKALKKEKKRINVKGNFMDMLKEYSEKDKVEDCPVVKKAKVEETWSILKDDFMMGAELKDWDKDSDNET